MKKLSPEHRKRLILRAWREERKRGRPSGYKPRRQDIVIELYGRLDLIEEEMTTRALLAQLDEIRGPVRGELNVLVDMSAVTDFDACALLYLVAQVDHIRRLPGVHMEARFPTSQPALKALYDARFDEFMTSQRRIYFRGAADGSPQLQISVGSAQRKLSPSAWVDLYRFLKVHGQFSQEETDALYQALGECIENVHQHAFNRAVGRRWYALALRPANDRPGRVVVLDLGLGIANTVRATKLDRVLRWMVQVYGSIMAAWLQWIRVAEQEEEVEGDDAIPRILQRFATDDWFCVYLATLGLRTETAQAGRGTGLLGLRDAVLAMKRGSLHVLSGEAAITWKHEKEPRRKILPPLRGTAVCLDVGGSGVRET